MLDLLDASPGKRSAATKQLIMETQFAVLGTRFQGHILKSAFQNATTDAETMEQIAVKLQDAGKTAVAICLQCDSFSLQNDFSNLSARLDKNEQLLKESPLPDVQADHKFFQATLLLQTDRHKEGLALAQEALALSREADYYKSITQCLSSLSFYELFFGTRETGNGFAHELLDLAVRNNDRRMEAQAYNSLALHEPDFGRQRGHFEKSLDLYSKIGFLRGQRAISNNLSLLLWRIGLYNRSLDYISKGVRIAREMGEVQEFYVLVPWGAPTWASGSSMKQRTRTQHWLVQQMLPASRSTSHLLTAVWARSLSPGGCRIQPSRISSNLQTGRANTT